jgi:hypothetical protein
VVDESNVYWAEPGRGTIGRASLDGSDPNYAFIGGASNPGGIAVDDTHVYWTNFSGNSIGRANLDGTEVTQTFINAASEPCGVAVDHKFIYWASAGVHYVGRALLTGEKGPHLVDGDGDFDFCGLAVDSGHIYWTEQWSPSRIGSANLDGTDVDCGIVTGLGRQPCGIAVDGQAVTHPLPRSPSQFSFGGVRHNRKPG